MTVKIIIFQDYKDNTVDIHASEPVQVIEFYRGDFDISIEDKVIIDGMEWEVGESYYTPTLEFDEIWQKGIDCQAQVKRNEKRALEVELNKKELEMEEIKERLKNYDQSTPPDVKPVGALSDVTSFHPTKITNFYFRRPGTRQD